MFRDKHQYPQHDSGDAAFLLLPLLVLFGSKRQTCQPMTTIFLPRLFCSKQCMKHRLMDVWMIHPLTDAPTAGSTSHCGHSMETHDVSEQRGKRGVDDNEENRFQIEKRETRRTETREGNKTSTSIGGKGGKGISLAAHSAGKNGLTIIRLGKRFAPRIWSDDEAIQRKRYS